MKLISKTSGVHGHTDRQMSWREVEDGGERIKTNFSKDNEKIGLSKLIEIVLLSTTTNPFKEEDKIFKNLKNIITKNVTGSTSPRVWRRWRRRRNSRSPQLHRS